MPSDGYMAIGSINRFDFDASKSPTLARVDLAFAASLSSLMAFALIAQ
jgi:hypothetical protein